MGNAGTSIRIAVKNNDSNIMDVVLEALAIDAEYFGFYWDDGAEEWNFWTSETAENTASNCYYNKRELLNLLNQHGPLANDLSFVRGAEGIYGPGTRVEAAHARLSEAGYTVNFRIDSTPLIYFNGQAC